jgi:hypothetical protein
VSLSLTRLLAARSTAVLLTGTLLAALATGCASSSTDTATEDGSVTTTAGSRAADAGAAETSRTSALISSGGGSTVVSGGGSTDDGVVIEATVAKGKVEVSKDRFEVPLNSPVRIRVTIDTAEPVHLHGYDIEVDATPGAPAEISFVADAPGVFEVELEDSGTLLFEIAVS